MQGGIWPCCSVHLDRDSAECNGDSHLKIMCLMFFEEFEETTAPTVKAFTHLERCELKAFAFRLIIEPAMLISDSWNTSNRFAPFFRNKIWTTCIEGILDLFLKVNVILNSLNHIYLIPRWSKLRPLDALFRGPDKISVKGTRLQKVNRLRAPSACQNCSCWFWR